MTWYEQVDEDIYQVHGALRRSALTGLYAPSVITSMGRHSTEHLMMRGVTVKTLSVLLSPEKHGKLPVFFAETAYALAVFNQENAHATI